MTKEERREYNKSYKLANKQKEKEYYAKYRVANKESISKRMKSYRLDNKDNLKHEPLVYLLVKENYVGVTENLRRRLNQHTNRHGRDISEVIILKSFNNKSDALELERALHNEGYKGGYKHKNKTND